MKTLYYITGKHSSGKSTYISQISNSVEVDRDNLKVGADKLFEVAINFDKIVFTSQTFSQELYDEIKVSAMKHSCAFLNINL